MPVLLVAYDVNAPKDATAEEIAEAEARRSEVAKLIATYSHRLLSESAYAIETPKTPAEVAVDMWKIVAASDVFFVIPLAGPVMGQSTDARKWLEDRLRR